MVTTIGCTPRIMRSPAIRIQKTLFAMEKPLAKPKAILHNWSRAKLCIGSKTFMILQSRSRYRYGCTNRTSPLLLIRVFNRFMKGHPNSKYMGNITQLDHALGMVMDALDEQGVSENTFLFFTSDNGPEGRAKRMAARRADCVAVNAATTKAAFVCLESLDGQSTLSPTRPATCQ